MGIRTLANSLQTNYIAPLIQNVSSLTQRVQRVARKNAEAYEEAVSTGLLLSAGLGLGLLAGSLVSTFGRNAFSLRTSLFYSFIGILMGTAASSPIAYRFFSEFKTREDSIPRP